MRRLTLAGLLALVLAVCLLPLPVLAQSTIDADIGSIQGFDFTHQVHSFYAAGRYWVFYQDTTPKNLAYRSSTDALTWNAETTIGTADPTGSSSVWFDGTYGHYIRYDTADDDIKYRRFIPNADGSVTYSAAEQTALNGAVNYYEMTVAVDTDGSPWVAYSSATKIIVTKSSTTDGTWATEAGFPSIRGDGVGTIIALTGGKVLLVYGVAGQTMRSQAWDGAFWSVEKATTTLMIDTTSNYWSVVAQDDDAHLTLLERNTNDVEYERYLYSSNSWGNKTTLGAGTTTSAPVICLTNLNDLYVFVEGTPNDDKIYYYKFDYYSGIWGSIVELVDETVLDGLPSSDRYLDADQNPDSDKVGVYYVSDPQKLKYKDVSEPVVVVTLAPNAVTSSRATLRGEIVSVGTGTPDVRGFEYRLLGSSAASTSETGTFGLGVYNLGVTDLEIDEIYEVRAFVVSGGATVAGSWLDFLSGATGEPESPEDAEQGMVPPVPTSAPGGWITDPNDRTFDGWFGSDLINSFADAISRSFVWFLLMVFAVGALGIGLCKFTRHLGITFLILGILLGLFIVGDYLDWFYIFPYLLVGFALIIREGQFSWN